MQKIRMNIGRSLFPLSILAIEEYADFARAMAVITLNFGSTSEKVENRPAVFHY
jgi:hypothetical protein